MTTTSMVSSSTGSRSVASGFLGSRPRQTGPAAVYILQRSDRLRFKLGWSNDPVRRARELPEFDKGLLDLPQSWALWLPNPARALQIEQSLHRGLTPYRVPAGHEDTGHTEWFSPRVLVPAMRLLGEMPSGDRHGRTLALRPVLQPGPETVDIASGDCTAMETWFALEDLWLPSQHITGDRARMGFAGRLRCTSSQVVLAMSSCNVRSNRWARSPASAGGSVLQESCNASTVGATAGSSRRADSSAESGTCTIKDSCNARAGRRLPRP